MVLYTVFIQPKTSCIDDLISDSKMNDIVADFLRKTNIMTMWSRKRCFDNYIFGCFYLRQ